jgi:ubiquitin-activating enzyme E1
MAQKQDLSRQDLTYGADTAQLFASSSVLVSGINGLGVEIAKNVLLSGIKVGLVVCVFKKTV